MSDDVDLTDAYPAKSNRLNADDLIGKDMLITVTKVLRGNSTGESGSRIYYEGDNGKPFEPCKTMGRLLKHAWGANGKDYIGRQMILYRDEAVVFGGMKTGGVRIRAVSHIDKPITVALMVARGKKEPFILQPLKSTAPVATTDTSGRDNAEVKLNGLISALEGLKDEASLEALLNHAGTIKTLAWFEKYDDVSAIAKEKIQAAKIRLSSLKDDQPPV